MAFYFALMNVSKKDDRDARSSNSNRKHRRHSIASIESPLHDYRLLPKPQLLTDDIVLTNEQALQEEENDEQHASSSSNKHCFRRSRGSARASKWVQDNQRRNETQKDVHSGNDPPSSSRSHHDLHHSHHQHQAPSSSNAASGAGGTGLPLSRSKRMAFPTSTSVGEMRKKEREKDDEGKHTKPGKNPPPAAPPPEQRRPSQSRLPIRKKSPNSAAASSRLSRPSWKVSRNYSPPVNYNGGAVPASSSASALATAAKAMAGGNEKTPKNPKPICRVHVERALNITRDLASALPSSSVSNNNPGSATATDDSRRSSAMSIRRDDSPASSCDLNPSTSFIPTSMKLSGISMSSRSSEPRLKKVTFECSPYVISNSFLGDRAVLVRRGSGTAVRRMPICDAPSLPTRQFTSKVLAPHDEVCGDAWWTPCSEAAAQCKTPELIVGSSGRRVPMAEGDISLIDNRANEAIEKLQARPNLRRLLRRRSTSDKSRIIAYRNTGFLSSSQERNPSSRMTASVDRPNYNNHN